MRLISNLWQKIRRGFHDDTFLISMVRVEGWVAKILSLGMVVVIIVALAELGAFLVHQLWTPPPIDKVGKRLFTIFGLFLNVLIALEILENITSYLKKHVIQVELVIVTALIAVARKVIILDLDKVEGLEIVALGFATFALAGSYWIMRNMAPKDYH